MSCRSTLIVVGVDGVGVGATVAESLRTQVRRAVENQHRVEVGAIVATCDDSENSLRAGVALDWRRSVPAVKLIGDIRVGLTWKRTDGSGRFRLKWYEAPETEQLAADLASLQHPALKTDIAIQRPPWHWL